MKKIIKEKGRVILVEEELIDIDYWDSLFKSLTFEEGMAAMQSISKLMIRYGFHKEEKS